MHSQMMIAEAHVEMGDSHWMASLKAAFSARKKLRWVIMGACHTWTRSSRLRTTKPTLISNRTICEDLEVRWENGGKGLKRKVSLL